MNPTSLAPSPTRATTNITISCALLSVPCSVYTGKEGVRVERKEFFRGDANIPVGRAAVRKDTGEVIETDDVVRMAQATSGAWVALSDDEIAACTSPKGLAEVITFVPTSEFSTYVVEDIKQVRPKKEKGKANPAAEKAFDLILTAMRERNVLALIKVAMRGPARYALLSSNGDLFLIATADTVRGPLPIADTKPSEAEVAMACSLIDAIGIDAPVLSDTTAPVVQEFVNNKAQGIAAPVPEIVVPQNMDLVAQIQASIDAKKAAK